MAFQGRDRLRDLAAVADCMAAAPAGGALALTEPMSPDEFVRRAEAAAAQVRLATTAVEMRQRWLMAQARPEDGAPGLAARAREVLRLESAKAYLRNSARFPAIVTK